MGIIITTLTPKLILAVNFHYVAELGWETWTGIHQWLSTVLAPKLGWSQEWPGTELKGRGNKARAVFVSCL